MVPSKFQRGDRVVGIDLEGKEHHGVIKTVWRRLDANVYGVQGMLKRLRHEQD